MKVLVVGGAGMLGTDLVEHLTSRGHEPLVPTLSELDITDTNSVAKVALKEWDADWCVNCAAYTAVDKAETEIEAAYQVNALGAGHLAKACAMAQIKFLHISTDFVFDGTAKEPYLPDDPTQPLGVYGKSKRDGEHEVFGGCPTALVLRTAWLYGPNGPSFPRTMLRVHSAGKPLRVVSDQIGCPTYTADLSRVITDMVEKDAFPGTYHGVGPQAMSWHKFAELAIEVWTGAKVALEAIPTEAYPTPAKRPAYSVLDMQKTLDLGVEPMRPVRAALEEFCARLRASGREL